MPSNKFPAKVISVNDIEMPNLGQPDEDETDEDETIAYYGCKICTDKGDIIIDYRNESNGYYGGGLSWPDDTYYYGGVWGQNISEEKWIPLKNDI